MESSSTSVSSGPPLNPASVEPEPEIVTSPVEAQFFGPTLLGHTHQEEGQ